MLRPRQSFNGAATEEAREKGRAWLGVSVERDVARAGVEQVDAEAAEIGDNAQCLRPIGSEHLGPMGVSFFHNVGREFRWMVEVRAGKVEHVGLSHDRHFDNEQILIVSEQEGYVVAEDSLRPAKAVIRKASIRAKFTRKEIVPPQRLDRGWAGPIAYPRVLRLRREDDTILA